MAATSSQNQLARAGKRLPARLYHSLRIRLVNAVAIVLSALLALFAAVTVNHIFEAELQSESSNIAYRACSNAARDLQEGSDYLTSQVRVYVATGNREYLDAYMREIEVTDRRGRAVETIKYYLGEKDGAVIDLEDALGYSNSLAERELYAIRLTAEATNLRDLPALVEAVTLEQADAALSPEEQRQKAEQMVLGDEYQLSKYQISASVNSCSDRLLERMNTRVEENNQNMRTWLNRMRLVIMALLGIVVLDVFAVIFLILWPLATYTQEVKDGVPLTRFGSVEMRYMADAYNTILAENRARTKSLQHAAERDHLTGIYNRGAFDQLMSEHTHDVALLIVDVDYFKEVNDGHGHKVGDAVLTKVAQLLERSFRMSDLTCRIGGDEFAVIATGITPNLRHVLVKKVRAVSRSLADTSDGLPPVTISVGIAFSEAHAGEPDLYKAADKALYVVKERGRNGYAFYDEIAPGEVPNG